MIGKFTGIIANNSGSKGGGATNSGLVREEDVHLQASYEYMELTNTPSRIGEIKEGEFLRQQDFNQELYEDLYAPGWFWVPLFTTSTNEFNTSHKKERSFNQLIVVNNECVITVNPYFESRILKVTDELTKLSIKVGEYPIQEFNDSPKGTLFVVASSAEEGKEPFITEFRPHKYLKLSN